MKYLKVFFEYLPLAVFNADDCGTVTLNLGV